jgi:hypothetical protein
LIVYEDFVDTVVLVSVLVVVFFSPPAVFSVLVFFIKLTPDNRLAFNDSCVRALRAAV